MIKFLFVFFLALMSLYAYSAELKEIKPGFYTVTGPLADFDPSARSVSFTVPSSSVKPPLVIIAHGGSGLGRTEENLVSALNKQGIATLIFDAYRMNGFNEGFKFWNSQVTNEARQRMLYQTTLGAYKWALQQSDKINTQKIYLQGVSNGASVVTYLSAVVDPVNVKGVFAEGLTGNAGIGFPNQVRVPVRVLMGKEDNYGGGTPEDMRWLQSRPCRNIVVIENTPEGSSKNCNENLNADSLSLSTDGWVKQQQAKGVDVQYWFYDNATHAIMLGGIDRKTMTFGNGAFMFASTGADSSAQEKMVNDLVQFIKKN
jgi:dienelactone hydrolase